MTAVLIDTHTFAWITSEPDRLSPLARQMIETVDDVFASVVSLYEIAQKVRLGKWPEMASTVMSLNEEARAIGVGLIPVIGPTSLQAGLLDWSHRDPFDRIIAATALAMGLVLISTDRAFDSLPDLQRIW